MGQLLYNKWHMDFNKGFQFYSKYFHESDPKLSTMGASTLIGKRKKIDRKNSFHKIQWNNFGHEHKKANSKSF